MHRPISQVNTRCCWCPSLVLHFRHCVYRIHRQLTDPLQTGALTMMAMGLRTALACTVVMLLVVERCAGQEKAPSEEGAETFKLLKSYYRHKAKQYEFT